jgi:hypothetical protein
MCQLPLFSSLAHLPALAAPPRWHSGVKAPESSSPADAMTSAKPSPRNCVSLGLKPTSRAATCFSRLDVVVNNAGKRQAWADYRAVSRELRCNL